MANTVLHALDVVALVLGAILPGFLAVAVLLVILPLTFVGGAVHVLVHTETVSLIVLPVSNVNITVSMDKSSLAVGHAIDPVAFVHALVTPDLGTLTVSLGGLLVPLSGVRGTVFEDLRGLGLKHLIVGGGGLLVELEIAFSASDFGNKLLVLFNLLIRKLDAASLAEDTSFALVVVLELHLLSSLDASIGGLSLDNLLGLLIVVSRSVNGEISLLGFGGV